MNDGGTTIFLTTHNMEEADRLCARVAFLNEGRIAETGVPAQLKLKYAKDRVRVLLEDGETLECARNPEAMGARWRAFRAGHCVRAFGRAGP